MTGVLSPLIVLRLGRALDPQEIVFFPEFLCFLEHNLHLPFVFSLSSVHVTSGGRATP